MHVDIFQAYFFKGKMQVPYTAMFFSAVSIRAAIFMARRFFEFMFIMGYLTVVPIWLVCSYWLVSLLLVLQFVTSVNMCCVPIWMG